MYVNQAVIHGSYPGKIEIDNKVIDRSVLALSLEKPLIAIKG